MWLLIQMYSVIFYSTLFPQVSTQNHKTFEMCLFFANFIWMPSLSLSKTQRMRHLWVQINWIHLFWLWLSLSPVCFVIQIYLPILASSLFFFFSSSVLFKFHSGFSPGAPYHPSHRTIDGTKEASTLSNAVFIILEWKSYKVYFAPLHCIQIPELSNQSK